MVEVDRMTAIRRFCSSIVARPLIEVDRDMAVLMGFMINKQFVTFLFKQWVLCIYSFRVMLDDDKM
jgi:hypothetical protein